MIYLSEKARQPPDRNVEVPQENGNEKVKYQDDDKTCDKGFRGGAAHTMGALAAMEALVTTYDADGRTEERALYYAYKYIEVLDVLGAVNPVLLCVGAVSPHHDTVAAEDAEKIAIHRKERNQQEAGKEPRNNEVLDGVGGQRPEGVDLLGDLHRAELGSQRPPDSPRKHDGGKYGPNFLQHADIDYAADARAQADALEVKIHLDSKDHADKRPGDAYDGDAEDAYFVELRRKKTPTGDTRKYPPHGLPREDGDFAQPFEALSDVMSQKGNRVCSGQDSAPPKQPADGQPARYDSEHCKVCFVHRSSNLTVFAPTLA